jgi:hypothetical protein
VSTQELDAVLADPRVWRGRRAAVGATAGLPSGCPALDAALPEGGFPANALTEVHSALTGIGELSLLLPVLAERSQHGVVALIAPPHIPYAPAFAAAGLDLARLLVVRTARPYGRDEASSPRESCWAMEQALRDGACGAVVGWFDQQRVSFAALRRLQLAAEAGNCFGVVFRAWDERSTASPAALRLALSTGREGLRIAVLKCRGRAGRFAIDVAR